jgi:hypothetical protein
MQTRSLITRSFVLISLLLGISLGFFQPIQQAAASAAPNAVVPQVRPLIAQKTTTATTTETAPTTSFNWSGYAATNATFTKVQAWFAVPKVTCTIAHAEVSIWAGLDGFANSTVEQAGVDATCGGSAGKTPVYTAWWEMYPANTMQTMPLTVLPGNVITVNVNYVSGKYLLEVVNGSRHTSYTKTTTCANRTCSRTSAEWIVERPILPTGSYAELADYNSVQMYNDSAETTGSLSPMTSFTYSPITMINSSYGSLATVSNLASTNKSFYSYWKSVK